MAARAAAVAVAPPPSVSTDDAGASPARFFDQRPAQDENGAGHFALGPARSAAFSRRDNWLAAWRSLGVAGVGSDRAQPAMRRGEQEAQRSLASPVSALIEPSRRWRRPWQRACASAVRPAHAWRVRRRSNGATTRSRLGACSVSPVSALIEPSRRCDEESRRRGGVTRYTAAHTAARTCGGGTTGARTTRSAALGRRDGSLAARRSLGVAGLSSRSSRWRRIRIQPLTHTLYPTTRLSPSLRLRPDLRLPSSYAHATTRLLILTPAPIEEPVLAAHPNFTSR